MTYLVKNEFLACLEANNKLSRGETICPPPIAADLRWPGRGAARLAGLGAVGQTDGTQHRLMSSTAGHNNVK